MNINIALSSNLFKEKELVKLGLLQKTYLANLKQFGKELRDIKELSIDHADNEDIDIFKALQYLNEELDKSPELKEQGIIRPLVYLDEFRIFQTSNRVKK